MALLNTNASVEKHGLSERTETGQTIQAILKFIAQMSTSPSEWAKELTKSSLMVAELFSNKAAGWEVIMRGQGEKGPEGPLGAYRLEEEIVRLDNKSKAENAATGIVLDMREHILSREKPTDSLIASLLTSFADLVGEDQSLRHSKWLSPQVNAYFQEHGTYPKRVLDNFIIRMLVPQGAEWGYVDIDYKSFVNDLRENHNRSFLLPTGYFKMSNVEYVLRSGETSRATGVLSDQTIKHVVDWDQKPTSEQEAPLLVVSLTSDPNLKLPRVHNGQMLAHLAIGLDADGEPKRLALDFAHVPIWGRQANELKMKLMNRAGVVSMEQSKRAQKDGELPTPERFCDSIKTSRQRMSEVIGSNPEKAFGEDRLLLELAKNLDVFMVSADLKLGEWLSRNLGNTAKFFGGTAAINNLAILHNTGQSSFYMVDHKGPRGLQVALGVGGLELLQRIRNVVSMISEKTTKKAWSSQDLSEMASFLGFWKHEDWRGRHKEELLRAKIQGLGSISTLAAIAGDAKDLLKMLSSRVASSMAIYTECRRQSSAIEGGTGVFWTAGSQETEAVLSTIGESVAIQVYSKDPVVWAKTLLGLLEQYLSRNATKQETKNSLLDALQRVVDKRSDGDSIYDELDSMALTQVTEWVFRIYKSKTEEKAVLGSVNVDGVAREMGARELFGYMSEDTVSRKKVIEIARVMAAMVNELADQDSRWIPWKVRIIDSLVANTRQELLDFVLTRAKLGLVGDMCDTIEAVKQPELSTDEYLRLRQVGVGEREEKWMWYRMKLLGQWIKEVEKVSKNT